MPNRHCTHLAALVCSALVFSWDGATAANTCTNDGDWHSAATWDGGVPATGQDVAIPSGFSVTITNSTASLTSLTNAGTLTFDGWATAVTAATVVVQNGGDITHVANAATTSPWDPNARVYIVCTDLTVENGGTMDASALGFKGRSRNTGYGPGRGDAAFAAGYGGKGQASIILGQTYGSPYAPEDPGSGGGGGWTSVGGHGGGAVRIEASGHVSIDGTIRVDGGNQSKTDAGAGSGGAIYITCQTFGGSSSGLLSAQGGTSSVSRNGGGGRIAIDYDTAAQAGEPLPQVSYSTTPGNTYLPDFMGTLALSDATFVAHPFTEFQDVWLYDGITNWTAASLSPVNSIGFGESNSLVSISGTVTVDGNVALGLGNYGRLACADLVLTNGGSLAAYAGSVTNATNVGAVVSVSNAFYVGSNCWVFANSHLTDMGTTLFAVGDLTVAAGGGFDADAEGYPGGTSRSANTWGNGSGCGAGPGYGTYSGGHGASHGGLGGGGGGGGTYGSSNAPVRRGSGGGAGWTGAGGDGGGAIRIEATNAVVVDGTITAGGGNRKGGTATAGSGGSILIMCDRFSGAAGGLLAADGGSAGTQSGGGGGRIAVSIGMTDEDRTKG